MEAWVRCTEAWMFLLLVAGGAWAAPVVQRDARGVEVRLEQPARRIVTLTPHLTELVSAAGAGAHLVGVARFSNYPPEVSSLPVISDSGQFDLERILGLKPDLVLAWQSGTPRDAVSRLERLGLKLFVTDAARLEDIPRNLEAIAALAGTRAAGDSASRRFAGELQSLRGRQRSAPPVRVFYEIWPRPLMTVNGAHIISDVIQLCGGVNVFGDVAALTPEVSREALLAVRPEAVLGGGSADTAESFSARWATQAPPLNALPGLHIPPDLIQRPTPRLLTGARLVCAHLDAVRAARR